MEPPQGGPGALPPASRYVLSPGQELQFRAQTVAIHLLRHGQAPDALLLAAANGKCEYRDGLVVQVRGVRPRLPLPSPVPSSSTACWAAWHGRRCAERLSGATATPGQDGQPRRWVPWKRDGGFSPRVW